MNQETPVRPSLALAAVVASLIPALAAHEAAAQSIRETPYSFEAGLLIDHARKRKPGEVDGVIITPELARGTGAQLHFRFGGSLLGLFQTMGKSPFLLQDWWEGDFHGGLGVRSPFRSGLVGGGSFGFGLRAVVLLDGMDFWVRGTYGGGVNTLRGSSLADSRSTYVTGMVVAGARLDAFVGELGFGRGTDGTYLHLLGAARTNRVSSLGARLRLSLPDRVGSDRWVFQYHVFTLALFYGFY
jgi:hypothetical protein